MSATGAARTGRLASQLLRALVVGAGAALRSPLWVGGRRITRLLDRTGDTRAVGVAAVEVAAVDVACAELTAVEVAGAENDGVNAASNDAAGNNGAENESADTAAAATDKDTATSHALPADAAFAARAARGMLRRLARLPLSPWRNTCLYRSIAECLVLRYYGVPAAVRLGVRNEAPPHGAIVAHAWVVYPGSTVAVEHVELMPAGASGSRWTVLPPAGVR